MQTTASLAALSHRLPNSRWKVRAGRLVASGLGRLGVDVIAPVRLADGSVLLLDPRGRIEGEPFWDGSYDADQVRFLEGCLTAIGPHLLDIGANVGLIAIPLARAGAEVDAFEPVPANAARVIASARLSGVADRVRVRQVALGEADGTLSLVLESAFGAATGNAVAAGVADGSAGTAVDVPVVRLDDLGLGAVDVIKIDVEGAEVGVLRGGMSMIAAERPVIIGEFHSGFMPRYGHSFLDVADLLTPLGYRYFSFVSATEVCERQPHVGLGNVVAAPDELVASLPVTIVG
jgi:FkbM family methyltransferase